MNNSAGFSSKEKSDRIYSKGNFFVLDSSKF